MTDTKKIDPVLPPAVHLASTHPTSHPVAALKHALTPPLTNLPVPPRSGLLPDDFPGVVALRESRIVTYEELAAFAPDYRVTGVDADEAARITAELAKTPPTGVAAKFCLTGDQILDGVAVGVAATKNDVAHWDVYAGGRVYKRARIVSGSPHQPGEFSLVVPEVK